MPEVVLKGGFKTKDPRLDRIPQLEPKNRRYAVARKAVGTLIEERPKTRRWTLGTWLDQGSEGACVGFARAHDMASKPQPWKNVTAEMAKQVYDRARQLDQWPGDQHSGSSVLGGALAAVEFGYLKEYWWAFTLEEFLIMLSHRAPAVVGVNWYSDMADPDAKGYIHPTGSLDGGHSILLYGQSLVKGKEGPYGLDLDASYVLFWNSWGKNWGKNGTARMTMRDWDKLRKEDGEVCFSVGINQQEAKS